MSKGKQVAKTVEDEESRNTTIWLQAVEDMELSAWEQDFVASCSDLFFGKGRKLSPKQYETLEKVYRKFF